MEISANILSKFQEHQTTVTTNGISKSLSIAVKPNGFGSSINGGELLLLALATCYCNDLYREANKKNIPITAINVNCNAVFEQEGAAGSNFRYQVKVDSPADPHLIQELIRHTDSVAEIQNTLRKGSEIELEVGG